MNRVDQLHRFLEEEPNDPFNLYALALEYQKSNKLKAKELYDQLLTSHQHYIPGYYHAGKLYIALNKPDEALQIFENGIVEARQQNDFKAMHELQAAYNEIVDDN